MNKQIEEMANDIEVIGCNGRIDFYRTAEILYNAGYRKQSEEAIIDYLYEFKSLLTNKFIELCNHNDYGKINLLLIGDTIDETFDDVVEKMKGGAE